MAKFYLIGKISGELMKRMQNEPTADRFASTKKVTEAAGLKLISYEWVRGRFDVISCVEGEYEQAVALKIAFLLLPDPFRKKLTVKGIIGKTQGVIKAIKPAIIPAKRAAHKEPSSSSSDDSKPTISLFKLFSQLTFEYLQESSSVLALSL